jgi:hypothetical protein
MRESGGKVLEELRACYDGCRGNFITGAKQLTIQNEDI